MAEADPAPPVPESHADPVFRLIRPEGRMAIPIHCDSSAADEIMPLPTGTAVRRGQCLASSWPAHCAAPLAPADGTVAGIGAARLTARSVVPAILFNATPTEIPETESHAGLEAARQMLKRIADIDPAAGIERLRQCGVWADRWGSPNLLGQLRASLEKPVSRLICSVLDESPEILLNQEAARVHPVELAAGVIALAELIGAEQTAIVIAAYADPAVWESLRYASAGSQLRLLSLEDHYPQANASLLIHETTGRHVRPSQLPTDEGVFVLDAMAAIAIGRCLLNDEPMLTAFVGLREKHRDVAHWLNVPIGMPWTRVLSELSISETNLEIRAGSPLREIEVTTDCVASGAKRTLTVSGRSTAVNPDPCIRCGWCVEGCPVRIQPAGLLEAAQQDDIYLAERYGLDACIECGICSYVCPSKLGILKAIRGLRADDHRNATKQVQKR